MRLVFLLALLARVGGAALTEWRPIFPAYFDADAAEHHRVAKSMAADWREGRAASPTLSPAKRVYDYALASLYRVTGPRPLLARLANAVFSALAVLLLFRLSLLFLSPPDAMRFGVFLALWPSYVYVGGINTKDPLVFLLVSGVAFTFLSYLRSGVVFTLASAAACLLALGLLKTHFVLALAAGLSVPTALLARFDRGRRLRLLAAFCVALAAGLFYRPVASITLERVLVAPESMRDDAQRELKSFLPRETASEPSRGGRPSLPQRIGEFRDSRHYWSQQHARLTQGRRIETQILPGERFEGWLDLLLFLPRGAFHTLFMPLPSLYPLDDKLGRWLGAIENVGLLALALLACLRLAAGGWPREALVPLGLFVVVSAAYALFEFDLGSAARHKPEYLPFLLLFAFRSRAARASPSAAPAPLATPPRASAHEPRGCAYSP